MRMGRERHYRQCARTHRLPLAAHGVDVRGDRTGANRPQGISRSGAQRPPWRAGGPGWPVAISRFKGVGFLHRSHSLCRWRLHGRLSVNESELKRFARQKIDAQQGRAEMSDVKTISRRALVKTGFGVIAAPAVLRVLPAEAQSQVIKIGHVSPKTGPLAGFGEADTFILDQVRGILSKGLVNNGKSYKVEIISKDSQSSGSRAAEVASELILGDKVNLIVGSATPDTTNPVSDQAEVNEVPCITTNCPWQPYFFGRKGDPKKGFTWTYHFFWGLEDVIASFLALWDDLPTNKIVGGLFPNDADGNAWGDAKLGLPP